MSVLEYAINVLKVRHVIVCGHYGCGGVRAAIERQEFGLIDNWLRKIKDVYAANKEALDSESDPEKRLNLLCEINVRQQVLNICHTSIVQNAWREGRELAVHGWIYSIADGLLRDLGFTIDGAHAVDSIYHLPDVGGQIGF
jgi:carbonic anhydrase